MLWPTQNDEDVKIVVGNNFDEIVLDESKDVLLEVLSEPNQLMLDECHCMGLILVYDCFSRFMLLGVGIAKHWSQHTKS